MKKAFFIALYISLLSACSKKPQPSGKTIIRIIFDGRPEPVYAAKSATEDRHCTLHGDPFSYRLIKPRIMISDSVINSERIRREKIFFETLPIAPNAIPFPPDWIFSQGEYSGGRILPTEGIIDLMAYEYCQTCEKLMQTALKTEPNQPLQTTTMAVTPAAPHPSRHP